MCAGPSLAQSMIFFSVLFFFFPLSVIKKFIDPKEKYIYRERSETVSAAW